MSDIRPMHRALIARVLADKGTAPRELRRAAFDNDRLDEPMRSLVAKVAYHATEITDDDIAAVRNTGSSEDQIFEIVVCAAVGQATRQYESGLAALAAAAAATASGEA